MLNNDEPRIIEVTGIVSPAGWDERGVVESVCIAADDGKYYYLNFEGRGAELQSLVRKNVMVRGAMSIRAGQRTIFVADIKKLPDEPE